jgi:hypothetical protein
LVHALVVLAVHLVLLLESLLEPDFSLVEAVEEGVDLVVEFVVASGREESDEVVVDLLAQLCWRLVVPIFALEDVLQHG